MLPLVFYFGASTILKPIGGPASLKNSLEWDALDVNGDDEISPIDALLVINHLNAASPAEPEGNAADAYFSDSGNASDEDLWLLLALDAESEGLRRRQAVGR